MPTYKNISQTPVIVDGHMVQPEDTVETLKIYNLPELEKISDEPYYPLTKGVHEIEATEPGITPAEGVALSDKDCAVVRIETNVDVDVYANSLSNPYPYPLTAQEGIIDIENEGKIEKVYLDFKDGGKVRIIETS